MAKDEMQHTSEFEDVVSCPECNRSESECTCDACAGCEHSPAHCICDDDSEPLCPECDMHVEDCICEQEEPICGICGDPLRENCDCEPSSAYGEP